MLRARTLAELRDRRVVLGIGQPTMAGELTLSQSQLWRIEANELADVGVVRLSEMASLLGLELSIGLHELGDPIRDKGQQALAKRFEQMLSPNWRVTAEAPLPRIGDLRAWDRLLRLLDGPEAGYLIGVDLETRIRDIQAIVRRTRQRERDGHVDAIVLALSDSATNRHLVAELRHTLGDAYATASVEILAALKHGLPLSGSGVILV